MTAIKNVAWLDTHKWGVRAFCDGNTSAYNHYKFKRGWNDCPDWNSSPVCGGGFHLMTPEFCGHGFHGTKLVLVEWRDKLVAITDSTPPNKAKVKSLRIMTCTNRVLAEALRRCGVTVVTEDMKITDGLAVVLRGRWRITQSGGELRTCDRSQPRITQSGGILRTYDQSQPRITQSGGDLWTYDQSQPRITRSVSVR